MNSHFLRGLVQRRDSKKRKKLGEKNSNAIRQKTLVVERLEDRRLLAAMTEVPVVGGVTDDLARIFVRTDEAASVAVEYSTASDFQTSSTTPTQTTNAADDYTQIIELSALQADTTYYYRILVDNVTQQTTDFPSFSTFPLEGTSQGFNFTVFADVGSHPKFPYRPAPAYAQAASEDPAFVLQIGDLDHRDPADLAAMRTMHRETRSPAELHGADFAESILSNFPLFHVWDDHDYGLQDGDKNFSGRADAWQAFKEYYPTPDLPNPDAGIWHSFSYAQAEMFMLDLRSQRDPHTDPDDADKSMLDGDNILNGQKEWLFDGLLNSDADWKFVITSVPFNPGSKQDAWRSYQAEAAEIVDFIEQNSITGVVLISGDLHSGGGIDDGTNSFLPEIAVPHTNLTRGDSGPTGQWSEGYTSGDDITGGYLSVQVLTNPDKVIFETKDADGNVTVSWEMDLMPPPQAPETVYLSLENAGELTNSDGSTTTYNSADILQLTGTGPADYQYSIYFDGSDVGLQRRGDDINLDAFDILPDGSIVLSSSSRARLRSDYTAPGNGSGPLVRAEDEDLLRFTPSALGEDTAGSWSMFLDASTVGLTDNIDAVSVLDGGSIVVSVERSFDDGTVTGSGQDLFLYDPTTGLWEQYFDGSDVDLTRRGESIDALALEPIEGSQPRLHLSAARNFGVPGISGGGDDVFVFDPTILGTTTSGSYDSVFTLLGSDYGIDGLRVDGFDLANELLPMAFIAPVENLIAHEAAAAWQRLAARDTAIEDSTRDRMSTGTQATVIQPRSGSHTVQEPEVTEDHSRSPRRPTHPRKQVQSLARWTEFRRAQIRTNIEEFKASISEG